MNVQRFDRMGALLCWSGLLACLVVAVSPLRAQEIKLMDSERSIGAEFGTAVGLTTDHAIVGARVDNTTARDAGAAYIFGRNGATWTRQAKLFGAGGEGDLFGISVAIDGDYAVVGATGDDEAAEDAGAVFVFLRTGSTWSQQAKLFADDADPNDRFGSSVAIDGDYLIIGATNDDERQRDAGAVYVFARNGATWALQDKIIASDGASGDILGNTVALLGDRAVIGAVGDDFAEDGKTGSAYVFMREEQNWVQGDKLFANDGAADFFFGNVVSASDDFILVGMSKDDVVDTDAGSAYIFVHDGEEWVRHTKLVASAPAAHVEFGHALALSGNYAVITAPGDDDAGEDAGAVYLFEYDPAADRWGQNCVTVGNRVTCTESAKFMGSDTVDGDEFGFAASLSGTSALVGARFDDDQGSQSGSAYVIVLAAPGVPSLATPPDQATGLASTVSLTWEALGGAGTYQVQVAPSAAFTAPVADVLGLTAPRFEVTGLVPNTTYFWRVAGVNHFGTGAWSDVRRFSVASQTAVEQVDEEVPATYQLHPNYPNPFNPGTTLRFALPAASRVTLTVYDATGAAVATLVDASLSAGTYTTPWNAEGLASGLYVARLRAGKVVQSQTMVLLK